MRYNELTGPLFHVSKKSNRKKLLATGLTPRIQEFTSIKRKPGIYLFQTKEQALDWAFWFSLDEQIPVDVWQVVVDPDYKLVPDTHPEMDIYNAWIGYSPISSDKIICIFTQKTPKSTEEAPSFAKKV